MSESHSVWWSIRHPVASLREICGGEAIYPILVLFGLNAVDELDRDRFRLGERGAADSSMPWVVFLKYLNLLTKLPYSPKIIQCLHVCNELTAILRKI